MGKWESLGVSRCLVGPQSAWDVFVVADVVLLPLPVLVRFVIDAYVVAGRETKVAEDLFSDLHRQPQQRRLAKIAF